MTDSRSEAIEVLYSQHGAALLLFATALSGERSRGQDAVHQVFLRLLEQGGLDRVGDVKSYLFACVRNRILNDARYRGRDVEIDAESAWFVAPNRDYVGELSLRRALGALTDDQRQVTILHIWGELTFAQMAEVLGISPNTAASRYRYALAKLRDALSAKESACANPG